MSDVSFMVHFRGTAPEDVKVGDRLSIAGEVTVHKIEGALIDVTSYGKKSEVILGDVEIGLHGENVTITRRQK